MQHRRILLREWIQLWILAALFSNVAKCQNRAPTVGSIVLGTAGQPRIQQFYTCTLSQVTDPDDIDGSETRTAEYTFTVNGQLLTKGTNSRVFISPASGIRKGDQLQCIATVADPQGLESEAVSSNIVTIGRTVFHASFGYCLLKRV